MKVSCTCGSRAIVSRCDVVAAENNLARLFCSCKDPECGHTFVAVLAFKHSISSPYKVTEKPTGSGVRVLCGCGDKAFIKSSNKLSPTVSDLYCKCGCGHNFVMSLAFSHTLSPSASAANELLLALVRSISPTDRKTLSNQLTKFA